MSGTFYRSPAPGEPAFVKVGDKVTKGQTICIVEAMKLMNEIEVSCHSESVHIRSFGCPQQESPPESCLSSASSTSYVRIRFALIKTAQLRVAHRLPHLLPMPGDAVAEPCAMVYERLSFAYMICPITARSLLSGGLQEGERGAEGGRIPT